MYLSKVTTLLAEISVMLIGNGAGCNRTKRNILRVAHALNCDIEFFFSFSAVILTVKDRVTSQKETIVKTIGPYHVNFALLSEISIFTWEITQKHLSIPEIETGLERIRKTSVYPAWVIHVFIGLATGGLCMVFGGNWAQFGIAFLAAVVGLTVRRFFASKHYNVFMNWLISAFVSVSVVNIFRLLGVTPINEALTACVLWLIPGVPLINGFMDVIEGYIVAGGAKFSYGFFLIFMIAIGFYLSLFIFGINV